MVCTKGEYCLGYNKMMLTFCSVANIVLKKKVVFTARHFQMLRHHIHAIIISHSPYSIFKIRLYAVCYSF